MTPLLPLHRLRGSLAPLVAAMAVLIALTLPGIARADDTSQSATPTATTAIVAAPATAGTSAASANSDDTSATTPTDDSTSATDDTSATDTSSSTGSGDAGGGLVAQPDAASWR